MRRILTGVVLVLALFALLIFAALAIGSTQPPPEALARLHLTACALPCWLGITPGQTTFEDAVARVIAVYPQTTTTSTDPQHGDTILTSYQDGSSYGVIEMEADQAQIIRHIVLITTKVEGLAVGDVVALIGAPTCTGTYPKAAIYGAGTTFVFVAGTNRGGEGWQTALNAIDISAYDWLISPCSMPK